MDLSYALVIMQCKLMFFAMLVVHNLILHAFWPMSYILHMTTLYTPNTRQ